MVEKGAQDRAALETAKFGPFLIGQWSPAAVADIQPCRRTHPIDAVRIAKGFVVGRFQVGMLLDRFPDKILVVGGVHLISHDISPGIDHAQLSLHMLKSPVLIDQCQKMSWKVGEGPDFLAVFFHGLFEQGQSPLNDLECLRHHGQHHLLMVLAQRLIDASRHHPGGMDTLAGKPFDDLLAHLAQADAVPGDGRVGFQQAQDVAFGGV